ncbi:MAG: hypothetical protein MMC33_008910 [Icmadophila ericetorum]|nr:hypothetical protein [Icmadophila ericetorum]
MPSWLPRSMSWKERSASVTRYDPVQREEFNEKGSSSSTDGLDSEITWVSPRQTVSKRFAYGIISFLCAVIVLLSVLVAILIPKTPKSPIPYFPTHTEIFSRRLDWEYGPGSDDLWAGLIPNSGLVMIKYPEKYGLQTGIHTMEPNAAVYGVAITHQYHCLKMMRESFSGLSTGDPEYVEMLTAPEDPLQRPPLMLDHVYHCYDYLRQSILCQADLTLEWASYVNTSHIDGYGPPHQCRNWDDVYKWMVDSLPPDPKYKQHQ